MKRLKTRRLKQQHTHGQSSPNRQSTTNAAAAATGLASDPTTVRARLTDRSPPLPNRARLYMAAPPSNRSRLDARARRALPEDAVFEILLRLPAKDLCRLRAVCRPWRSLLSDQHFITAHAACHPLIVVVSYDDADAVPPCRVRVVCEIMDLSGRVIKRFLAGSEYDSVKCVQLDLLCLATDSFTTNRLHLLDPATGAVHALPEGLAAEHAMLYKLGVSDCMDSTAFGLVTSTGEYKVLRVLDPILGGGGYPLQLYEVFTLDHGNSQGHWRAKKAPPYRHSVELSSMNSVIMDGIVYFLLSESWDDSADDQPGLIASFDLEREEWGASIRGPLSSPDADMSWHDFSIAILSGCVILSCAPSSMASPFIDLWFLMDMEKGLWVKQHSIEINILRYHHMVQPLLVLNDGRIVLYQCGRIGKWSCFRIYNPCSKTWTDVVKMDHYAAAVCLYGGNLLSLANCTSS